MPYFCCNPYNKAQHKMKYLRVEAVTDAIIAHAQKINIQLENDSMICTRCKIQLYEDSKHGVAFTYENVEPIASTSNIEDNVEEMSVSNVPTDSSNEERVSNVPTESSSDDPIIDSEEALKHLNKCLQNLNVPSINKKELRGEKQKIEKLENVMKVIKTKIFELPVETTTVTVDGNFGTEMLYQLKEKMATITDNSEKYLILTMLPKSWKIQQIMEEFDVTYHMARRSKILRESRGFMVSATQKLGSRRLDQDTVKLVQDFYYDDGNSRACPGKHDCVTVNINGERTQKQRRLLLFTLNEGYQLFKEKYPDVKIGFTKFSLLRPRECILASDKGGTHTVCVCMYHQNVKLMFEPLKRIKIFDEGVQSYKDLIKSFICSNPSENCYLKKCKQCPRGMLLQDNLQVNLENSVIERLKFKQWVINSGKNTPNYFVITFKRIHQLQTVM